MTLQYHRLSGRRVLAIGLMGLGFLLHPSVALVGWAAGELIVI